MSKTFPAVPIDQTGCVLVVDDEEKGRELLRDLLELQGHQVTEAEDGEQALQKVGESPPDVVLLDVMMPGLDGFDVCRRLKGDPKTAPIPVLLVTALRDRRDRLKGIESGANDFLTKPIDSQDVILRVRNAVYTKHLFDQVQENYERLQELEALRDNLTHMIVHDMRSPLTGMMGFLQLLQMSAKAKLDETEMEDLERALGTTRSLAEMINGLLDVSRLESGEMPLDRSSCDLSTLASEAIESLGALVGQSHVGFKAPPEPVSASCDPDVIRRVIANLVGNAVKFTPQDGEVQVPVERIGAQARVAVADTGRGIPPEYHEKIFEKFGQVEARQQNRKYSTGLGLTFCKLAVEAHGGEIGVESEVGQGSTFWFVLSAVQESEQMNRGRDETEASQNIAPSSREWD